MSTKKPKRRQPRRRSKLTRTELIQLVAGAAALLQVVLQFLPWLTHGR